MSNSVQVLSNPASFLVLDASAGSGKTYTLVQHYLLNALRRGKMPDAYKRILAITFTNNAAAEMKKRVLEQLIAFAGEEVPESNEFFTPIWKSLGISAAALQSRAKETAGHMLHNYSGLSIGTIDQFTHRLVRTFTKDLALSENFELRLDVNAMLGEAMDLLYGKLGSDADLKTLLVGLSTSRMDKDKSFRLDRDLLAQGEQFLNEDWATHFAALPSQEVLKTVNNALKEECAALVQTAVQLGEEGLALLKDYDSSSFKYYARAVSWCRDWTAVAKQTLEYKKQAAQDAVPKLPDPTWDNYAARRMAFWEEQRVRMDLLIHVTGKFDELTAAARLFDAFEELKEEQNCMPLASFNRLIAEELKKEPSAYLYARIGERFWHFYIDEFQDTSVLQFENLHPLIEHTLTKEDSANSALIVGDAKQSIYRWRGGKAEQFIDLVDGTHPINRFNGHPNGHELYSRATERLPRNFRTSPRIVAFNNALFPVLSKELDCSIYANTYSPDQVAQVPFKDFSGWIVLEKLEDADKSFTELACAQSLAAIEELREHGWSYKDIALLVKTNAQAKAVGNYLTENGVPTLSADALVVGSSWEGVVLDALFSLCIDPASKETRMKLAYALDRLGLKPAHEESFAFYKRLVQSRDIWEALESHYKGVAQIQQGRLSLYALGQQLFGALGLLKGQNRMAEGCLDLLFEYQQKGGALSAFSDWWKAESPKKAIGVPESMDAVRISTVHRSKGLEYPHVIMPFGLSKGVQRSEQLWVDVDLHPDLQAFPLTYTKKLAHIFPEDAVSALEQNRHFDWINNVYVGFTRPVHSLQVWLNPKDGDLLPALEQHLEWDANNAPYTDGDPYGPSKQQDPATALQIKEQFPEAAFNHLNIAGVSNPNWHADEVEARTWGTAVHRILQRPEALWHGEVEKLKHAGKFPGTSVAALEQCLHAYASSDFYKELSAATQWQWSERSVVIPGQGQKRPDLVVGTNSGLWVVDYKTGTPANKDVKQVEQYMSLLQKSGFTVARGTLVYLSDTPAFKEVAPLM